MLLDEADGQEADAARRERGVVLLEVHAVAGHEDDAAAAADVVEQPVRLAVREQRHVAQKDAVVGRQVAQPLVGELRLIDDLGPGDDVVLAGRGLVLERIEGGADVLGGPIEGLPGRLAVHQQHLHAVLDRHHHAAGVVGLQAVVVHLGLDDVVAGFGEGVLEGDGDLFAVLDLLDGGRRTDLAQLRRLTVGPDLADEEVDGHVGARRAEVVQYGLEEGPLPGDGDRIGQRQPLDGEIVQAPFMAVAVVDFGQVEKGGGPGAGLDFLYGGGQGRRLARSQVVRWRFERK